MSMIDFTKIRDKPQESGQCLLFAVLGFGGCVIFTLLGFLFGELEKELKEQQKYLSQEQKLLEKRKLKELSIKKRELLRQSQLKLRSSKTLKQDIVKQQVQSMFPNLFKLRWLVDGRISLMLNRPDKYDIKLVEIFNNETQLMQWINNFSYNQLEYNLPF